MPNVNPRGLYGWPKEGSGSTPSPASAVFVALGDGSWCLASQVYEWCVNAANPDGAWLPVWGSPEGITDPISVTISQVGGRDTGAISVKVDWVHPSPMFANGWRILRPDGSVAGDVAQNVSTFTDTDPRPAPTGAAYRVAAILGTTIGAGTPSNLLVLGQAPLIGPAATMNLSANRVDLGMTTESPDNFTSVRLYRVGQDTAWWQGGPCGGGR